MAPTEEAISSLLRHVEPNYRQLCGKLLRGEPVTFAQAWQDWVLFHNYYSDRLVWGAGTYVDIGTNDPTQISNTLFFDKCLGWRGVCFEPQSRYHARIRANRSCKLVPHCVLGQTKRAAMVGEGVLAHVVEARDGDGGSAGSSPSSASCVAAPDVLRSLGFGTGPNSTIDLLSIDIEGAEPDVLRCWPYREFGLRHMLVETNKVADSELRALDRFFHRHGYANVETFAHGKTNGRDYYWLDNLYEYRGLRKYPAPAALDCGAMRRHVGAFCAPWNAWRPRSRQWAGCGQ